MIENRVKKIISQVLGIPEEKIQMQDKLISIVTDSIQLFELLIQFEKELGEKVNYDDIADIESVEDIVKFAVSKNYGNKLNDTQSSTASA